MRAEHNFSLAYAKDAMKKIVPISYYLCYILTPERIINKFIYLYMHLFIQHAFIFISFCYGTITLNLIFDHSTRRSLDYLPRSL